MRGGVDTIGGTDVAWTGGDPYDNTITSPAANGCYRPMEPDKARKVEEKCVQALPESRRLQVISSTVTQKQVPLIQWMKDITAHLQTNGMDDVFHATNKANQTLDLLDEWSQMMMHEVTKWCLVETWDTYDLDNIRMSGKFIRGSILSELYQRILFSIRGHEVGP